MFLSFSTAQSVQEEWLQSLKLINTDKRKFSMTSLETWHKIEYLSTFHVVPWLFHYHFNKLYPFQCSTSVQTFNIDPYVMLLSPKDQSL
jgi:hypothetical protein